METSKRMITNGVISLAVNMGAFILTFFLFNESHLKNLIVILVLGLIMMVAHQFTMWKVLYQFAITRRRMSNKLHMFNKLAIGANLAFVAVYLLLAGIMGKSPYDYPSLWLDLLVIMVMTGYIFVQENNTNNFVQLNLHHKINQSKKTYNQMIGFITSAVVIALLWLSLSASMAIPVMALIYLLMLMVQNSLSYTTFGQSKYWNLTYELVLVGHVGAIGLITSNITITIVGAILGLLLFLRQWKEANYKFLSQLVGSGIFVAMYVMMLLNLFKLDYETMMITEGLLMVMCIFLLTFIGSYLVVKPDFISALNKK